MNFYFCETCGKRLTDHDLSKGQAKNKKLKGVYCTSCAIGVTTMEALPLNDSDAQTLLQNENASRSLETNRPKRPRRARTTPGLGRTVRTAKEMHSEHEMRDAPGFQIKKLAIASVVASLLLFLVLIGFYSPKTKNEKLNTTSSHRQVAKPLPETIKKNIARDEPAVNETAKDNTPTLPQPIPETKTTSQGIERKPQPTKNIQASEERKADAKPQNNPANHLPAPAHPVKGPGPTTNPTGAPKSDIENEVKSTATRKPDQTYLVKCHSLLDALLPAIRSGDSARIIKRNNDFQLEPSLTAHPELKRNIKEVTTYFNKRDQAKRIALEKRIGKRIRWQTTKGVVSGFIISIKDETMRIETRYTINGKVKKGVTRNIHFNELAPGEWARLCPIKKPETPGEWLAQTLKTLTHTKVKDSVATVNAMGTHPWSPILLQRLERERHARAEAAATMAWEAFSNWHKKKKSINLSDEILTRLNAFELKHGSTQFAKANGAHRKQIKSIALLKRKGVKDKVTAMFKGKVNSLDLDSLKIDLHYSMNNVEQIKDFDLDGKNNFPFTAYRGKMCFPNSEPAALTSRRFGIDHLEFSMTLRNVPGGGTPPLKITIGVKPQVVILTGLGIKGNGGSKILFGEKEVGSLKPKSFRKFRFYLKGPLLELYLDDQKEFSKKLPGTPKGDRLDLTLSSAPTLLEFVNVNIVGKLSKDWLSKVLAVESDTLPSE